jgi:dihydropteroate synthase
MFIIDLESKTILTMNNIERNISLVGKSRKEYYRKIYDDKNSVSTISGKAIVCLTDTRWEDNHWQFNMRDIYSDDVTKALNHFKERGDISQIILIPVNAMNHHGVDIIEDLKRKYIHK